MSNVNTNKTVDEVTNKTSNSLMKKTKAQLVEIILRKDEVERNLRADMKGTEATLNKLKEEKTLIEKRYETLKNDYQEECDCHSFDIQDLCDKAKRYSNEIKRYKISFYVLFAISIGLIASIIF